MGVTVCCDLSLTLLVIDLEFLNLLPGNEVLLPGLKGLPSDDLLPTMQTSFGFR